MIPKYKIRQGDYEFLNHLVRVGVRYTGVISEHIRPLRLKRPHMRKNAAVAAPGGATLLGHLGHRADG